MLIGSSTIYAKKLAPYTHTTNTDLRQTGWRKSRLRRRTDGAPEVRQGAEFRVVPSSARAILYRRDSPPPLNTELNGTFQRLLKTEVTASGLL